MKKIISLALAFVLTFGICSVASAQDDIPEGYTPVYTAEDLDNIRNNLSGKYILMNDIDLSPYENREPIGTADAPFTGKFDGNGFEIINFLSENGFFANVSGAIISNLGMYNCDIGCYIGMTNRYKGGIADKAVNTIFENCYVTGNISGTTGNGQLAIAFKFYPGGLVGFSESVCFKNCYSDVDFLLEYTVMNPYAAGGLVGQSKDSEFTCCYSTSNFDENFIGTGNTKGMDIYTGGLIGESVSGNIFENCFYSDNSDYAVGMTAETPEGMKALSEDELKNQDSYIGFDFDNIWSMEEKRYAVLDFEKIKQSLLTPSVSLIDAEIIEVPLKNRISFRQSPKSPEGIKIELKYSDGTTVTEKVTVNEDQYYVNGELLEEADRTDEVIYGITSAVYFMNEGKIYLSYKYLAFPFIFNFILQLF